MVFAVTTPVKGDKRRATQCGIRSADPGSITRAKPNGSTHSGRANGGSRWRHPGNPGNQVGIRSLKGARMADQPTSRADAVAALAKAGQDGYDAYPRDCSHSIWTMLKLMGSPDEPYRTANDLMRYMGSQGSGWHRVLTVVDRGQPGEPGQGRAGWLGRSGRSRSRRDGHARAAARIRWLRHGRRSGPALDGRVPAFGFRRLQLLARRAQPRRKDRA